MNSYASAANEVVPILPHIDNALTIEHYCKTIRNELFEITVMEFKGNLVEQLFDLLVSEPSDHHEHRATCPPPD